MATMEEIEKRAREYAVERGALVELVNALSTEIERAKQKYLRGIRKHVAATKDAESALAALVTNSPELFVKPRTLTLHGVKVGYQKGKGRIEFDDADRLVARIFKFYEEEADALVKTTYTPVKDALALLPAADLKRLGITVIDAGDQVVVKPADGEVDKLVAALLKDRDDVMEEAA